MSNERALLKTPYVSPDSMRSVLKFMKSYFDGYTKSDYGYIDINGNPYVGTVRNFGSELFFESRKMLTNNVPIEKIIKPNEYAFYFDITYSELVNTYDQQGLMVACLKPDVLLSNCQYQIIFEDCDIRYVLRAESWSDPDVYRDKFYVTSTPPTLRITHDDDSVEDITLNIDSDGNVLYYYHENKASTLYIDSYDDVNHVLTTTNITNREKNLPFVWMTTDNVVILPRLIFENNTDINENPLLTVGTDGHSINHLYPRIYNDNYPDTYDPDDGLKWWIKVKSYESFDENDDMNPKRKISSITYVRALTPWSTPVSETTITYVSSYVSFYLDEDIPWRYHTPVEPDYDYDRITYNNKTYAYVDYDVFVDNEPDSEIELLKPGFVVVFDNNFLGTFESLTQNSISGIHIDTSSDYNENGVIEKNGVANLLGEFDGLPNYFKLLGEYDAHRSHIDLYSIRDRVNMYTQKPMEKQTSAIIMDSGISQRDMGNLADELEVVMKYNYEVGRRYDTVKEPLSVKNAKTALVFVDSHHIGDEDTPGRANLPHFIFHGNRTYSCTVSDMDPDLNYARGYLISNDPIKYENNKLTDYTKPDRTVARICDIPTTFSQLEHVQGVSPTIIIDKEYVRQYASYNDEDANRLWNTLSSRWVTKTHDDCGIGIFEECDLDVELPKSYLETNYSEKINLNPSITYDDCIMSIGNGGEHYEIDDEFTFYIGGVLVTGKVVDVTDGVVSSVTLDIDSSTSINYGNLGQQINSFTTESISGIGIGLSIDLTIKQSVFDYITNHDTNIILDGLFTLMKDKYGFIWVWEYNTESDEWIQSSQLTGPQLYDNPYDYGTNRRAFDKRDVDSVMMYNELNVNRYIDTYELEHITDIHKSSDIEVTVPFVEIDTFNNANYQNTCYVLYDNNHSTYDIECYTRNLQTFNEYQFLLPKFNDVNVRNYRCAGSSLQMVVNDDYIQPVMKYYNPSKSVIDNNERVTNNMNQLSSRPLIVTDKIGDEWVSNDGKLLNPLFVYNEFLPSEGYQSLYNEITSLTHAELVQYVLDTFGNLIGIENMSDDELIQYVMFRYYDDPMYKRNDVYKLREQNDIVIDIHGKPVGDQPDGGYETLIDSYKPEVYINGREKNTIITFILKIDGDIDLNDYHVFNDYDEDISEHCLIINNDKKYYFSNDTWNELI